MKILQLTAHFRPNIGGVETHLDDLCKVLVRGGFEVTVLAYRPLETEAKWKILERENNLTIIRIPWVPYFFYKLVNMPALEFIYLLPGLFLITPLVIVIKNPAVVHVHGLVAGFVGVLWGKLFGKRVIISTHSIYNFPSEGLYRNFVKWIFKNASFCLGLSRQAVAEIKSLGVSPLKVGEFTYWIDLNKFKVQSSKFKIKRQLGWDDKFTVLFVGRLVEEKGVIELLEASKKWDKNINLKIIGSGPLEERIKNLIYLGMVDNDKLPLYYSAADVLIVPSLHEEGFGRVILEALSCSIPVIGSNRGAIPEVIDETVGQLIDVTPNNIKEAVEYFYKNRGELKKLALSARKFAERRYSEKNAQKIIEAYQR